MSNQQETRSELKFIYSKKNLLNTYYVVGENTEQQLQPKAPAPVNFHSGQGKRQCTENNQQWKRWYVRWEYIQ